jgi:hypothetical protein
MLRVELRSSLPPLLLSFKLASAKEDPSFLKEPPPALKLPLLAAMLARS